MIEPIAKHMCSECGVIWYDNGPWVVFCHACAEELV